MNEQLQNLIDRDSNLESCLNEICEAYTILHDCYQHGGKVLFCGNGGSAADSEHIVGELMKGYLHARPVPQALRHSLESTFPDVGDYLADHLQGALPAISLVSQISFLTAYANDVAPDMIFAQQVYGYGQAGDVLVAISTSGESRNVLHALRVARVLGLRTLGFTGANPGSMADLCDVTVCVPYEATPAIQERHLAIYHVLCAMLENAFFDNNANNDH